MSLFILISIQIVFCFFLWIYFKSKINKQFKLIEFKNEINEIITLFNRNAEKHIRILENKITDYEKKTALVKKNATDLHLPEKQITPNKIDPIDPINLKSTRTNLLKKPKQQTEALIPANLIKNFYTEFSGTAKPNTANSTNTTNKIDPINLKSTKNNLPKKPKQQTEALVPANLIKNFYTQFNGTTKLNTTNTTKKKTGNFYEEIELLKGEGFSDINIAQRFSISTAEVKVISQLNKAGINQRD